MSKTTKKLKLQQYSDIYILNKPESFDDTFKDISYSESIVTTSCVECALVFSQTKDEFINQMLTLFPRLLDHSVVWVFYPNDTSISEISKLHIELDWDFLGDYRLKPTKLIAIDNTWNAMKIKKIHV
ncbi:hypothetical protein JJL45_07495 [Tamlana sp. s12]|uniref:DUF3052 domain-containing protein n=1 Tax=Pseudotamlana carrageenivorans TaxID=2069432 RepID=A0A2I7SEE0_9FLAO|nr:MULTISPECIES: hypothetical protein [Tamlana]AUS04271.1 hypothetical protein C1A40_01745 [Tamlana carrageenivorans]OBQ55513.1 hypothetical protein VQ01_08655 [Tamlana sp. s12]QQY83817.1 hypothetical protein JJL45_07495 [Tamlana sp. s12]